jgi:hypothetical protein
MNFLKQFKAAARVSTPLVAIRTFDASSAVSAIKGSYKNAEDIPLVAWDCMKGCYPYNGAGKKGLTSLLAGKPAEATVKLTNTLDFVSKGWGLDAGVQDCVLFLSNPQFFFKDPTVIQGIWNLRNVFKANGHMLVLLIAPGAQLPQELQNDILVLDEPLPSRAKLEEVIITNHKLHKAEVPTGDKLAKMVDAIVGLPEFGADQSTAMCIDGKSKTMDMDELWHKKREIIKQTPGLRMRASKTTLNDIGGNAQVVKFYRQVFTGPEAPNVVVFMDEIEKMFAGTGAEDGHKAELAGAFQTWAEDNNVRGGVSVGIPGVGKTALADALCGEYDVPEIEFDVAAMQDKHVGESGARLRAAMATVLSVAGEGGKILVLATSNGMDNLPLGLRARFGFAPTFFFDEPNAAEKQAIWAIQLKAFGLTAPKVLPAAKGWTGREIKQCCEKAKALGIGITEAADWVIPGSLSDGARYAALRATAHNKYMSASVPGPYQYTEAQDNAAADAALASEDMDGRRIKE